MSKGHAAKNGLIYVSLLSFIDIELMCFFSSHEQKVLKLNFSDGPLSVAHRPSLRASVRSCVNNFFKQLLL